MKKIIIYLTLIFLLGSCKDVLDLKPITQISDADVWVDATLMRAYLTNLYGNMPFYAFIQDGHSDLYSDIASQCQGNQNSMTTGQMSKTNDPMSYWGYNRIRSLNEFLVHLPEAPILESEKKQMEGEVRVMRAFIYFEMQKRYGGVPLVDVVLDPFSEIDQKYKVRSTEEDIADFIDSDLDIAIGLLTEDPEPRGRFNKWSAYALKARANLYSASIAKYGDVQLDGLVGIPAGRADDLYTKASNAANSVISSGKYTLYKKYADKAINYQNIFIDQDNPEVILAFYYDGVNKTHVWTEWMAPPSWVGRGSRQTPTLDFVLEYENIDGSDDQPVFGPETLYETSYGPFENKDPRLKGTVFFDGETFYDGKLTVNTYEGLDPSPTPDVNAILSSYGTTYKGVPVAGEDSRSYPIDDYSSETGFIFKKYLYPAFAPDPKQGSNDFWVFRLGEMYLTVAEAEFELGNMGPAATALNGTRERAGISLVDETTITINHIRTERRSELALESGFRWWDLRRWRIAEEVLNGRTMKGLRIIKHYESGKYYFLPINSETFSRVFRPEHYYNPITNSEIDKNKSLIENPLY